ncbi:hypothetical protein CGMCC3_g18081 [Colletotrichum fructicola]|nr:uncharacterized protein CGMCC3_g18081 [Colletotrichum fructicola]KAE9565738.1 hypothetical protein CGMCC3_g18081 [Colletotrichum fructicola]
MANPSPSLKSHCHELGGSDNGMLEVDALVTTNDYQYIDPKLLSGTTSQVTDAGKLQQYVVNATEPQTHATDPEGANSATFVLRSAIRQ